MGELIVGYQKKYQIISIGSIDSIEARFTKSSIDHFFVYSSLWYPQFEKYCDIGFINNPQLSIYYHTYRIPA